MQTQNENEQKKMSLCIVFFAQKNLLDGSLSLSTCGDVCVYTCVGVCFAFTSSFCTHTHKSFFLLAGVTFFLMNKKGFVNKLI